MRLRIQRALISVFEKAGVVDLARALRRLDVEILSTGGTARLLTEQGVSVVEVADYTGFPEIMDGRVKTLHPRIHGGLLGRRPQDEEVMTQQGIRPIDLLVVNLYPFEQVIAEPGCDRERAVEHIDVGGPAMLRAAAKNFANVTVVVDAGDYAPLLEELRAGGGEVGEATRRAFAAKAFALSARYDGAIADYLEAAQGAREPHALPAILSLQLKKAQDMRYGENPHQRGAFYIESEVRPGSIAAARQLQGKALSYNNVADADAALECVKSFARPSCVIVKHANPCGVATAEDLRAAYEGAYRTDPASAFGGIIALNRPLDDATAQAILERQFVEVIVVPQVVEDALKALSRKPSVRVLACGQWEDDITEGFDYKRVTGGLLAQDRDSGMVTESRLKVMTERHPSPEELKDLMFSWKVVKFVKSNAIVFGKEQMIIGIGAGQMSRIESVKIAISKARENGLSTADAVMASDAFFPFRDGIDTAAEAGIKAIIQPGGSVRDNEVIEAANRHDIAMIFTGMRHFRH
ncbi:MAG: bifunctional phosphoribosylaminoimidazolecarboxamide formyltransferase/IMP cyclohydrolase [Gammaproteobacteria bacterium]